jgi:hypothetical protein
MSFRVQGGESEPYAVEIRVSGAALTMKCSCMAGTLGQWCKNKMSLATGDTKSLASGNAQDVAALVRLLPQTPIVSLLRDLVRAEQELEAAKQKVRSKKAALATAVAGR